MSSVVQPETPATHQRARRIELTEWQARDIVLSDEEVQSVLRCSAHIEVQALRHGVYRLRPRSLVGLINADGLELCIAPKCEMPALLAMLAEVHEFASLVPELSGYQRTRDIVDLLVQMFLEQVSRVVRIGLRRSYITEQDELVAARGRVEFRESAALHFLGRPKLFCTYEEYTLNGTENQLLLAALNSIWRQPLLHAHRRSLSRRLTEEFEDVVPAVPTEEQLRGLRSNRLNMHYWPAIGLAELILQQSGVVAQFGDVSGNGFLIDMNKLFEKFVYRKLRSALTPLGIGTSSQRREFFDEEETTQIIPDLCFTTRNTTRMAGDTKYKTSSVAAASDLYQMLSYCQIMKIRHGVLITVGDQGRTRHTVRNGETVIDVVSVDLSGTVGEVEASILAIADWISDSIRS